MIGGEDLKLGKVVLNKQRNEVYISRVDPKVPNCSLISLLLPSSTCFPNQRARPFRMNRSMIPHILCDYTFP